MLLIYMILISATLHNISRFVIAQRRYKYFHIVYFYLLVFLIISIRVSWFTMIFYVTFSTDGYDNEMKQNIFILDSAATYLELLLGIQ